MATNIMKNRRGSQKKKGKKQMNKESDRRLHSLKFLCFGGYEDAVSSKVEQGCTLV